MPPKLPPDQDQDQGQDSSPPLLQSPRFEQLDPEPPPPPAEEPQAGRRPTRRPRARQLLGERLDEVRNRRAGPVDSAPPSPEKSTDGPRSAGPAGLADQLRRVAAAARAAAARVAAAGKDVDPEQLAKMRGAAAVAFAGAGAAAHRVRVRRFDHLAPNTVWRPSADEVEAVAAPAGFLLARFAPSGTELLGEMNADVAAVAALGDALGSYVRRHSSDEAQLRQWIAEEVARQGAARPPATPPE